MNDAKAQLITSLVALILSEAPIALSAVVRLKGLLAQDPTTADNLAKIFTETAAIDQQAIDEGNKWLEANGYPPIAA